MNGLIRRRSDPTRAYLQVLLEDFRDPKYQPFTGDDVRRPRLEDVYLALDLRLESGGEEGDKDASGKRSGRWLAGGADRVQLPEALRHTRKHLALVGSAGSGKSTFLQWAGLVCAKDCRRERLDDDDQRALVHALSGTKRSTALFRWLRVLRLTRPLFPVYVALGEFDRYCWRPGEAHLSQAAGAGDLPPTADSLLGFICWRYSRRGLDLTPAYLQRQLRRGALLLFDGVDEVIFERRQRVRDAVQALLHADYVSVRTRVLLTSRPPGYDRAQWSDDFLKCDVQSMTTGQRDRLIRGWFGAVYTSAARAREKTRLLIDSLNASDERVQTMAATPLLATIFAKLQHNAFRIPDQRALLYKDAVDLILDETYRKSDVLPPSEGSRRGDRAQRLTWLSRIAFELHETGVGEAGLIIGDLLSKAGPPAEHASLREFLQTMAQNACLLEETQPNCYGFRSHRTFEEFLAGRYLMTEFAPNDLQKLVGFVRSAARSVNRDQWEEPLRLAVGYEAIERDASVRQFLAALHEAGHEAGEAEAARDWICAIAALSMFDLPEARQAALGELKPALLSAALAALGAANSTLNDTVIAELGVLLARAGEGRVAPVLLDKLTANPPVVPRAAQRRALGLALAALGDPRLPPPSPEEEWARFRLIPAGPARLGTSDADERRLKEFEIEPYDDEKPAHTVQVSEFRLAQWPVTNAEFARFAVGAKGYENRDYWSADGWRWRRGEWEPDLSVYTDRKLRKTVEDWLKGRPVDRRHQPFFWEDPAWNAPNLPVVGVTWFEAEAYANWLDEHLRGQLPDGWRVRLPTEAEWEKAARRAPTPTPALPRAVGGAGEGGAPAPGEGRSLWPWGDAWDPARCNSEESKLGATTPVGAYPRGASADGVEDLIGNVWEWCLDAWDERAYAGRDGATDPFVPKGNVRLLRGGAFRRDRRDCRAASRHGHFPAVFSQSFGVRVCASPILHSDL